VNVHAMMDCSDGLSTDLARMMQASGTGAVLERVPVARSARAAAAALGQEPDSYALAGGEDFELLAAVAVRAFAHLARRFAARFGAVLEPLGRVRADGGVVMVKQGREEPIPRTGWDHFS
jgi:thiamine-monophosphate kinase